MAKVGIFEDAEPSKMHEFANCTTGAWGNPGGLSSRWSNYATHAQGAVIPVRAVRGHWHMGVRWDVKSACKKKSNAKSESMRLDRGSGGASAQILAFPASVRILERASWCPIA